MSGSGMGPIGMEQTVADGISDPYIMMVIMVVCLLCRYRDSRGISKFRFESPGGTQGAPQGGPLVITEWPRVRDLQGGDLRTLSSTLWGTGV